MLPTHIHDYANFIVTQSELITMDLRPAWDRFVPRRSEARRGLQRDGSACQNGLDERDRGQREGGDVGKPRQRGQSQTVNHDESGQIDLQVADVLV